MKKFLTLALVALFLVSAAAVAEQSVDDIVIGATFQGL